MTPLMNFPIRHTQAAWLFLVFLLRSVFFEKRRRKKLFRRLKEERTTFLNYRFSTFHSQWGC
jgi:hypothetical protein